jgi:transcriptional regulator with XRE-family HTH domain
MGDHDNLLILFGQRLRETREAAGLSQEALADLGGMHRTYVGSIERGERNVSLVNIVKLADALRVSPAVLIENLSLGQRAREA